MNVLWDEIRERWMGVPKRFRIDSCIPLDIDKWLRLSPVNGVELFGNGEARMTSMDSKLSVVPSEPPVALSKFIMNEGGE